ncbi:sugar transferase [Lentzea sp. NPDC060358]|uniref:sugar transferase n=1 Tax=Lentzea sp. NPDC060358 TaxID=3347103 RepID=UPI003666FDF4
MSERPWWTTYRQLLLGSDAFVVLWAVVLVPVTTSGQAPWREATTAAVFASAWFAALTAFGSRAPAVLGDGHEEYRRVLAASTTFWGLAAIAAYVLRDAEVRGYLLAAFPTGLAALVLSRWLWRQWVHAHRWSGRMSSRVLLVGDPDRFPQLADQLDTVPCAGFRVVGTWSGEDGGPAADSARSALRSARRLGADTIAVTGDQAAGTDLLRHLSWLLEGTGTQLVVVPAAMAVAEPRIHARPVAGLPVLVIEAPRFTGIARFVKRVVDVSASATALVLLSPVVLALAVAIKVDSAGPVLYRQTRSGRHGREFQVWKFRTMTPGADRLQHELAATNEAGGPLFKMRADPRVTRLGRHLRRWSLDELPQLVNVLMGQMSLVGPRPPLPSELRRYDRDVRRRLLVKPGMTGLWQISGRSDLTWHAGVELDLYYVENWSFTLDLIVLWKTARAVLSCRGAY